MKDTRINEVSRAGLYTRVSKEEMAKFGLSLDAQLERLQEYAKENNLVVADIYTDAGHSARKPYNKRPEFVRLLDDVKSGHIDTILFTKLDRWFRNIADFFEVQKILDKYNVCWIATEEKYDTSTTNGRLNLNIKLTIAQDEADRDSDRVKDVFRSKLERKEVVSGMVPRGFVIVDKRLAIEPEGAEVVRRGFQRYIDTHSIGGTARYMREVLGAQISFSGCRSMLTNTLYIGEYQGIKDFGPAIIDREQFKRVQEMLLLRAQRNSAVQKNIYLFSGICFCAECGATMHSTMTKGHKYYRCRKAENYHSCAHDRRIREDYIEDWLLKNLALELEKYNLDIRAKAAKRVVVDEGKIRRKMDKLKDLYLNDLIERDVYERDYSALRRELEAAQAANAETRSEVDVSKAKEMLALYPALPDDAKKAFWNRILKRVEVDAEKNISITPA